jgi:flagellar export protein FliJ
MSPTTHDAGMRAVARVRGVREQDSRLGLQQSLAEQHAAERRASGVRRQLAAGEEFTVGAGADFVARRAALAALGAELVTAEATVASAQNLALAARSRWQEDKTRLSAVEMLLERRADERLAVRLRTEARELDDIAAQLHQRRATTEVAR